MAVSYTHLDVYKRQDPTFPHHQQPSIAIIPDAANFTAVDDGRHLYPGYWSTIRQTDARLVLECAKGLSLTRALYYATRLFG